MNESLNWRYATQLFDPKRKLSDDLLFSLLDAARLAPSSYGLQPWKFFVVNNREKRSLLRAASYDQAQITDASHLIVIANLTALDQNYIHAHADRIARERDMAPGEIENYRAKMLASVPAMSSDRGQAWVTQQVYLALGFLLMACAHERVDACPIEGFKADQFDTILSLKQKGYHAQVVCALGYRDTKDKFASQKKVRLERKEIIEFVD